MTGYIPRPGALKKIFANKSTPGEYLLTEGAWGRDLLIIHQITGASTGGHLEIEVCADPAGTVSVPHNGNAIGLPAAHTAAGYHAVVHDIGEFTKLKLVTGDGAHNVWVQVLA